MGVVSNETRKSAIAFHTPSGNGSDRVLAQCCSMQASFSSIFLTVFMSSSVSVGDVAVFLVAVAMEKVVTVAAAAGVVAEHVAACFSRVCTFFAAFFQMLSMVAKTGSNCARYSQTEVTEDGENCQR